MAMPYSTQFIDRLDTACAARLGKTRRRESDPTAPALPKAPITPLATTSDTVPSVQRRVNWSGQLQRRTIITGVSAAFPRRIRASLQLSTGARPTWTSGMKSASLTSPHRLSPSVFQLPSSAPK